MPFFKVTNCNNLVTVSSEVHKIKKLPLFNGLCTSKLNLILFHKQQVCRVADMYGQAEILISYR